MNLLIEQRPTTKTSKLQTQSTNENDVNNNLSSPLVLKIKRQTTKYPTDFNSNLLPMSNEDNNSRLTSNNQRLKRPIPNSPTTRRPSSPAFNGKQQVTKRSVTIDNNNNDLTSNIDENSSIKRFKHDDFNHSSSTKVDASVETVSIGLATEPDQLGPCEPGTSVVLEGIVWNETDSGVLVVNVTWRGKTYVGTLLDSTKQDWACPRLTCESPTSDYDARNSSKTSRGKRVSAGGNNRCTTSSFQQLTFSTTNSDDRKLRNNIKSRQSKRLNINSTDETSAFSTNLTSISETQLISCPQNICQKKFVSIIALNYHLTNTHKKSEILSIPQANTRDEEDVAHILANVADYVRRPSPEHHNSTTLTWPCPQISSNLVLSSSLNNSEQDQIKSPEHFLLHIQDEPNKTTLKIPTPPPSSSFISINPTIQPPPTSSSPAYSDISDEDPNDQIPPSTINLLTSNIDDTAQLILQQYGSYTNRLNSKPTPNGTSDSAVKNLLDSRHLSTTKSPSPPLPNDSNLLLNDYQKNLYHFHTNGDSRLIKPNENLLHPSTTNPLDYNSSSR